MKRFIGQVGIREKLERRNLPRSGSNRGYDPKQIFECFWQGIRTLDIRYIPCDRLRYDQVSVHIRMGKHALSEYLQPICGKFSQGLNFVGPGLKT